MNDARDLAIASIEAIGRSVTPLDGTGLGVAVDEEFLRAHPVTEGQAWR